MITTVKVIKTDMGQAVLLDEFYQTTEKLYGELARMEQELLEKTEALEQYADPNNWSRRRGWITGSDYYVSEDGGRVAREVLEKFKGD